MIRLDWEKLKSSAVAGDPFPHVLVAGFVAPPVMAEIVADLPRIDSGGSFPVGSLHLHGCAAELVEALEGPELRESVAELFRLDIAEAPVMTTLRCASRPKDGRIHRDSADKLVTVLLYLNAPGETWRRHEGCLRLLRGPDDLDDYAVEVPPDEGSLLIFPNGPATWHGHRPYVGPRFVLQLNYMASQRASHVEIFRHRVSAALKRLSPSHGRA